MLGEILDVECMLACGVVQLSVTQGLLQPLKRVNPAPQGDKLDAFAHIFVSE